MRPTCRLASILAIGTVALALGAAPAAATFPGHNGRIAFMGFGAAGDEEILDVRPDGSQPRNLTNHPAEDFHESYSADGRQLVFSTFRDAGDAQDDVRNHAELYVMDADGSDPRRLTYNALPEKAPAWSPDGRYIVFWRSPPIPVVDDPLPPGDLWVLDLRTGSKRNITNSLGVDDDEPQWSPDGRRIVFTSDVSEQGNADIHTVRPDGSGLRRLTTGPAFDGDASYSPDSRQITFTSDAGGNSDIYVMGADGGRVTRLTDDPREDSLSVFSPDGRFIAYNSEALGAPIPEVPGLFHTDVVVMRADGSQKVSLTRTPHDDEFRPDWQAVRRGG